MFRNIGMHEYLGTLFWKKGRIKDLSKTGVVQFGVGTSISPVNIIRHTNTNKAGVQEGKKCRNGSFGFPNCGTRRLLYAVFC